MRYYSNVGKNPVSFRLSDEAVRMLAMLSDKLGLSQASVIEFVLRWFVKKEKMEEK
jgi:predicted transcriptional regulator